MANISITRNKTLPDSSQKSDFHDLVDTATATISNITGSDIDSIATANTVSGISLFNLTSIASGASISDTALQPIITASKVSGQALFNMASLASTAGLIPYFNVVSSLASGGLVAYDGTSNFVGTSITAGVSCFTGSFNFDLSTATGTTVSVTGVGFTPTHVLFITAQAGNASVGHCFGIDNGINKYCIYNDNSGNKQFSSSLSMKYDNTANDQDIYVNSFDADGFTLNNTKSGSPTGTMNVIFIAFG